MLWSLPKGHIELGETAEQTAIREVAEETGIQGSVLAALGSIDYWFVTEGRRVHKTVHHYLMRFLGGELSDEDVEVTEVAWVPLKELPSRLAYADERRLAEVAGELIDKLHADGPAALPPLPRTSPRRRGPDALAHPQPSPRPLNHSPAGGRTAADKGRDGPARAAARSRSSRCCWLVAPARCRRLPAAGAQPGTTHVPAVQIDSVTPDVVTTTSDPMVTVTGTIRNVGDRPVRDVVVRLEHAGRRDVVERGCAPTSPGTSTSTSRSPTSSPSRPELPRGQAGSVQAGLSAAVDRPAVAGHRRARRLPGDGQRQRHPGLRRAGPARRRPLPAAGARRAARPGDRHRRRRADVGGAAGHHPARAA